MAKKFNKENYINVPGFAIVDLQLSGNELLAFSIIHGFSQDESSEYSGSLSYMSSALNTSRQTIINTLKSLVKKGIISKKETIINSVKFNSYRYDKIGSQKFTLLLNKDKKVVKNLEDGVKNFDGGGQKSIPNNTINNKEITINKEYIDIFDFWNLQDIKNHREYNHDKEIKEALKISTTEEIKQSIKNYKEVLESDFYFSFKWTLSNFLKLQRGKDENNFKRFLNGGDIWDNYQSQKKKTKPKQETYKNDLSKYDSMMEEFNKNLENFKKKQNESPKI